MSWAANTIHPIGSRGADCETFLYQAATLNPCFKKLTFSLPVFDNCDHVRS